MRVQKYNIFRIDKVFMQNFYFLFNNYTKTIDPDVKNPKLFSPFRADKSSHRLPWASPKVIEIMSLCDKINPILDSVPCLSATQNIVLILQIEQNGVFEKVIFTESEKHE